MKIVTFPNGAKGFVGEGVEIQLGGDDPISIEDMTYENVKKHGLEDQLAIIDKAEVSPPGE